ncbi:MAG: S41 family peptidase [Chloroflexi bacterium]|nr:S41 family peptidase [Chloroflexota bacterium]
MIRQQVKQFFTSLSTRPTFAIGGALLVLAGVFWIGAGVGYGVGRWSADRSFWPGALPISVIPNGRPVDVHAALDPKFGLFWEAMDLIYRNFDGRVPDGQQATYDAIRGVVNNLGDPNTSFLTPQEADYLRSTIEGSFEGIGARVEWDQTANTLAISEPFENQPAWNAGLRRGDLVMEIDGVSVVGTTLNDAVAKIRGPKGSTLVLIVQRAGVENPLTIKVMRDRIEMPTISTDSLGPHGEIAYVRLFSFNQNAGKLVRQAIEDAMVRKPQALILDLRGNPGGLLSEAVKITSIFLQDQTVLLERFSDGKTKTYTTEGNAVTTDLPMVVLVNEGSASASEIVAGALQDSQRAHLVGTKTYGKGSVQLPQTLSDGSIMRVTIAHWFTPKNRTIHGTGLVPDTVAEMSDTAHATGQDSQLDAAVAYLTK